MKILTSLLIFLLAQLTFASNYSGSGALGLQNGALNIGADFDMQVRQSHSVGGFLLIANEKTGVRNQFWSVGADVKIYFGPDRFKLYVAPGFGITSFQLNNGDDEMTFGTVVKLGSLFQITSSTYFGLEWMLYTNWFSDLAPGGYSLTNAVVRFDF